MILFLQGHDFHYEIENLCRVFFPYEKITIVYSLPSSDERTVCACIETRGNGLCYQAFYDFEGMTDREEEFSEAVCEKEQERLLSVTLFKLLKRVTGIAPAWGILTGIHPVKLYRSLCDSASQREAERYFKEALFVTEKKIELAEKTRRNQKDAFADEKENSFSLYVSIPFCPTRCSYCSFVSQTVERSRRLIPEYIEKLLKEISYTAGIAKDCGLQLASVYIGGGTPTTLEPEELESVIDAIKNNFDWSACREFTVEAGRPDTITAEKLRVIRDSGVKRISINPQTMNDEVLRNIGRKHTAQQTLDAYRLAREEGIDEINMDLIIGLPGDTPDSFESTLKQLLALRPENITVHALALKHAAQMMQEDKTFHSNRQTVEEMAQIAEKYLTQAGYSPYYLYRQSRMAGNLENVGWTMPHKQCRYNIYTMEECHTILACGAGGVSKIRSPYSDRLERIFNFKYSYEYVARFEELLKRKDRVKVLYDEFKKDNMQSTSADDTQ